MPSSCKNCKIDLLCGTIDYNKCTWPLNWLNVDWATLCCNCFKEKTGWDKFDQYACLQCKTRVAQKAGGG